MSDDTVNQLLMIVNQTYTAVNAMSARLDDHITASCHRQDVLEAALDVEKKRPSDWLTFYVTHTPALTG